MIGKKRIFSRKFCIILISILIILGLFYWGVAKEGFYFINAYDEDETVNLLSAVDGWFYGNSSGTYQVDYLVVEPKISFINNTINCSNGSISSDVNSLLFVWYKNGKLLINQSQNIIYNNSFAVGDRIECGIVPQKPNGTVAYWSFDEGTGTTFYELVNNNSGTSTSADWMVGRNYYAVNISQYNNYTVDNPTGLNLSSNFTYEFWIMPTQAASAEIYNYNYSFRVYITSEKIRMAFPINDVSTVTERINSTSLLAVNDWSHVVFTHDNAVLSVYINGILDKSTNLNGTLSNMSSGTIWFGRNPVTGAFFAGLIDEVAIYNNTLTAQEVQEHYKNGIVKLSKNNFLITSSAKADFDNGSYRNLTYSSVLERLIFNNVTSTTYYSQGYWESGSVLVDDYNNVFLHWNGTSPSGTNVSMKIRTGTNTTDTTLWSDYSGSDPCYQNDSNMILGLAFSEGSGNFTKDIITGSKYVNMSNNDFWVEGKHGFGAYMYGEDSIDISDVSALRLSSPKNYSIEIWVKPKTTQNIAILGKLKYYLYLNGSGNVVFNASYDSNVTSTASISTLSNDSWSSIIVTYDSDNTTKLYINGSLEKTQLNNGTMDESTVALCLGYSTGLSTFNGTIDSFVIYNRTLSDLEAYTHGTDKLTNASGEYTGKLSKYVQYRIYFETNNTAQTPQLQSSAIKFFGFSNDVYDSAPENISLSFPQNNTAVHTESVTLNWTTASDLEGDPVAYELVVSNYSNFSSIIISNLAINNFSYIKIDDDNYGGMVEHLDTRKYLQGEERWSGNWSDTYSQGWNGEGMNFHIQGEFMRTSKELVNESGTIEFWVKPGWNASDGNTNYFIQDSNNEINLNRTGTIIYLKLGLNGYLTYNISSWNSSDWHHVGISWQKNKNLTLNIDGVEVNKTSTSLIITGTGGYFYLGSNASTSNNLLANGTIDEFRVSSVARVAVSNLTKNNFTITTKDLSDGVYYWKVRPIQARNNSKEGEKYYGTWSDTWILSYDPHTPELSVVDDPVKVLGSINTSINLSSSENVYCEYRTRSTNYAPMSTTGGTNHSQTINFTGFGNFTYYINCNDSSNNFVNTTMVFYVFNKSAGDLIMTNTTKWNFTANQEQYLNFTNVYDKSYATINITTKNNLTGKAIAVRHDWLYNPESSGTGLPNAIVAYWTVVPDDWVTMNLSGNASITLRYYFVDISSLNTNILYIYYFENSTGAWRQLTETCSKYDFNVTFSTASFGTYALAGTVPTSSSTPGRGSSEGRGAAARAALAARLLAQRLAMLARRATPFIGFHDQVTNETTVVEEETPVEETEKEEETIATQAIKRISESVNESPWLWIVIYVIVAGVGTFFVARVGLAAILTFKKGKISIEELEKEEENIDRVKYYIYKNVDNPSMDQELLKKGWDANEVIRVIKGVKRLGRGRLEEYIYRKLSEGAEEEALVRTLVAKKWNEDAVRREIEKFKRI